MSRLLGFLLVLFGLPPFSVGVYGSIIKVAPISLPVPDHWLWHWISSWMPILRRPENIADCISDIPLAVAAICIGAGIRLIVGPKNQQQPWEKK